MDSYRRTGLGLATVLLVSMVALTTVSAQSRSAPAGATVWDGPTMTFTKADGSDPTLAANQDRLTASVWLTRANSGGQIYNIRSESSFDQSSSPAQTRWAEGSLDEVGLLTFRPFRAAVGSPQEVVGRTFVMHIVPENVYLEVTFRSWSQGRRGGFSYERTTP